VVLHEGQAILARLRHSARTSPERFCTDIRRLRSITADLGSSAEKLAPKLSQDELESVQSFLRGRVDELVLKQNWDEAVSAIDLDYDLEVTYCGFERASRNLRRTCCCLGDGFEGTVLLALHMKGEDELKRLKSSPTHEGAVTAYDEVQSLVTKLRTRYGGLREGSRSQILADSLNERSRELYLRKTAAHSP
jgi:hypothetical protein